MNFRKRLDYGGISFLDLIFNLLLLMTAMFIIAFIHISKNNQGDVTIKENYLVILEWNEKAKYDIDIHLKAPNGSTVWYGEKHHNFATLERDDLGSANDQKEDGTFVELNREVIYVRYFIDGFYVINVHLYSNSLSDKTPQNIYFELVKLNPYRVIVRRKLDIELSLREEHTLVSFIYDSENDVVYDIDIETQFRIVGR